MFTAVTMLLRYLSDSPVAPLQSRLVEVPEPFCSEISDSVYENFESCIGFTFSGVPTQQLGLLEDKYVHTHSHWSLTLLCICIYITFKSKFQLCMYVCM